MRLSVASLPPQARPLCPPGGHAIRIQRRVAGLVLAGSWAILFVGTVFAADSPIGPDEGLPRVEWVDAAKVVGRTAFVSGRVLSIGNSGRLYFINFDDARPSLFTAVVFAESLARFPESLENLYQGKVVRIRGLVTTHQGRPQIVVRDPSQVETLTELPPTSLREPAAVNVGEEVSIATYNVLNLFDDVDDPYTADEGTRAKPRGELEKLAASIRAVNADVLALQEVENRHYLQRFLDVFLADMGYAHVVLFEGNDDRGIDVAVVSRVPVGLVHSHRHRRFRDVNGNTIGFERDLLIAELSPAIGDPFEVWVVHLKSNYEGREYAEPIRRGEAAYIRKQLDERLDRDAKARIVLLGDFNDVWDSDTLRTICGSGPKAMSAHFEELPDDNRVTYNQPPYLSMIDFVLSSPAMSERFVKGSYKVWPGSPETTGSDHNPVRAKFRLKP